jgi:hypothetical protein
MLYGKPNIIHDLKVCDDGILIQLSRFSTLSIVQIHSISETGFCLRPQVEPTPLGPIDRASPYLGAQMGYINQAQHKPSARVKINIKITKRNSTHMRPSTYFRPSSDTIYHGTVIIPHTKVISEKFRRIANRFSVMIIFKTKRMLRETLMKTGPVLDVQQMKQCVQYLM